MARLMVIEFTKNKSTTGAMVKSIPSTIVKRTEMLCFTTLVSSSNSSIGCHILITSPPYASATFRIVGTISKIVKFKNPNFRHRELIMLAIMFLLCVLMLPIFSIISVTSKYSLLLVLYMISFAVSNIFLCYIRGQEKLFDYSIIGIIQSLLITIFNILFFIQT